MEILSSLILCTAEIKMWSIFDSRYDADVSFAVERLGRPRGSCTEANLGIRDSNIALRPWRYLRFRGVLAI